MAVNVLLKKGKNFPVGCAENTFITYVGFSFICLNVACENLDTWESFNITSLSTDPLFCVEFVEIASLA